MTTYYRDPFNQDHRGEPMDDYGNALGTKHRESDAELARIRIAEADRRRKTGV